MKEAIFFCIVGLPLFGKEGSGTPVFKILVRALLFFFLSDKKIFYGQVHFGFLLAPGQVENFTISTSLDNVLSAGSIMKSKRN